MRPSLPGRISRGAIVVARLTPGAADASVRCIIGKEKKNRKRKPQPDRCKVADQR